MIEKNITILVPGSCDASCDFCFWDREGGKIKPPLDYLTMLRRTLLTLSETMYPNLSISGGEPTISRFFRSILVEVARIRRERKFEKVILTTHGGNLKEFIDLVACAVDYVNISRHHFDDEENRKIFKSKNVPTTTELEQLIPLLPPVTFNCVIKQGTSVDFCEEFISFAASIGVYSISFRKESSNITPSDAEKHFVQHYPTVAESNCPVCRGVSVAVLGGAILVNFKSSVPEPSIELGEEYEVVFHPDGELYTDWGRKLKYKYLTNTSKKVSPPSERYSVGCGRSSYSTGC